MVHSENGSPLNPDDYDAEKLRRDIETCKESIDLNRWDLAQPLKTADEKHQIIANTAKLLAAKDELERLLGAKNA